MLTLSPELLDAALDAHSHGENVDWPLYDCDGTITTSCDDDTPTTGYRLVVGVPGDMAPLAPLDSDGTPVVTAKPRVGFLRWLLGGAR